MGRLIDENDVYSVLKEYYHCKTATQHIALMDALSTVKTVDAIPVDWIEEYLAWLESMDADVAWGDARAIKVMLAKWDTEQRHSGCGPDYCEIGGDYT